MNKRFAEIDYPVLKEKIYYKKYEKGNQSSFSDTPLTFDSLTDKFILRYCIPFQNIIPLYLHLIF